MTQDELKALRERLQEDKGFLAFLAQERMAARKALERMALNPTVSSLELIHEVMADYRAITRLSHKLLPHTRKEESVDD